MAHRLGDPDAVEGVLGGEIGAHCLGIEFKEADGASIEFDWVPGGGGLGVDLLLAAEPRRHLDLLPADGDARDVAIVVAS